MPEAVISREDVVKVIGKVKSVAVCTEEANAYLACMQASKADSTKCKPEIRALNHCTLYMPKSNMRDLKAQRRSIVFNLMRIANKRV